MSRNLSGGLCLLAAVAACALAAGCDEAVGGTGGGGGTSSSSSTAATTGSGGGGQSECVQPSDCPDTGNECVIRVCTHGACGTADAPAGTPLAAQTAGDCKRAECDGKGSTTTNDDDFDAPDDGDACTADSCANGAATHAPAPAGTTCSAGGTFCDGNGACVACLTDSDVPNDGNPCTVDACSNSAPSHAPAAAGAACGVGVICDGNGACVACNVNADCAAGTCVAHACVLPTCLDGALNGGETDVDCGGPSCGKCATTKTCAVSSDCASGLCTGTTCAQTTPIITAFSAVGHDRFHGVAFDAQGNILALGEIAPGTATTTDFSLILARFTPAGVLDTTFGTNGYATVNVAVGTNGEVWRGIVVQSTGKIVVSGSVEHVGGDPRDRDIALARFNANGTLDTTFGTNGIAIHDVSTGIVAGTSFLADNAWGLTAYPDDRLLVNGSKVRAAPATDTDFAVLRLTKDGALDTTFGTGGVTSIDVQQANGNPRSVVLLADGTILGGGYSTIAGVETATIYKLTSAGVLDTTFGTNSSGVVTSQFYPAQTEAYAFALQPNGKIVTSGYGRADAANESIDFISLRFTANGKLDPSYGINGAVRLDVSGNSDQARAIAALPDGRVLLAGGGRPTSTTVDGMIAIFTPNGQPDTAFSPFGYKLYDLGGSNDFFWAAAVAPSKKYVAVVGIKGVPTAGPGQDDTALVLLPIP